MSQQVWDKKLALSIKPARAGFFFFCRKRVDLKAGSRPKLRPPPSLQFKQQGCAALSAAAPLLFSSNRICLRSNPPHRDATARTAAGGKVCGVFWCYVEEEVIVVAFLASSYSFV